MYFVSVRKGNSSDLLFTEPAKACSATELVPCSLRMGLFYII